ncbi:serine hydrolase [Ottowia thiooxydans]|uniref:CubicO group peptidase (Beta-lactamase class C family) n=1 Tax=Ottowia thiooxydans TaxID=219182 RepID=A0ABV2QCP3_9BURK
MNNKFRTAGTSHPAPAPERWLDRRTLLQRAALLGAGVSLGGGLAACDSDGATVSAAAQVPEMARNLMKKTGIPGLAVAIVHRDETLLAEGYGVRRAGHSEAVNADTVFQLASVSKPLGATVVARQVGEGTVGWNTRMRELLPWFELSNAETPDQLTVADLYSHRSGLPDHAGDDLEEMGWSQREELERLRLLPLLPFRQHNKYTNAGPTLAGIGLAGRLNTDWATLSQSTLYGPLGMTRTTSRYEEFAAQSNRAVGHVRDGNGWTPGAPRNADPQSPAGGASSSVRDMANWLKLLLAEGRWQGRALVSAAPLQAAMSPHSSDGSYGFGFNVGTVGAGGPRMASHSGGFQLGAATCFMVVPEYEVGIIVLTNSSPIGVPEAICRQFLDLVVEGRETADWWTRFNQALANFSAPVGSLVGQSPPANPVPPQSLERYVGSYRNDYFGTFKVERAQSGGLTIAIGPTLQRYPMRHWSGNDFVYYPSSESIPSGSVSLLRFNPDIGSLWVEVYSANGLGTLMRV